MAGSITPRKTELGWVIDIPAEMAAILRAEPGSVAILYPKEGKLETEILPPPSAELQCDFERLYAKYKTTFEALKRLGD
ncbi:MAG: hypothetical protein ACREOH_20280 [Candidatus Entotheonellia bacterium]